MRNPSRRACLLLLVTIAFCAHQAATVSADVCLVRDGKVRAVVVTAVKPSPVAAYAVEELVSHVKQATGRQLPVVVETKIPPGYDSRVFVGVTEAARKQGIAADK